MHHPSVLKKFGCTSERLREIFTAEGVSDVCPDGLTVDQLQIRNNQKSNADIKKRIECRIRSRLLGGIQQTLQNYRAIQAVDVAWDSPPIQKQTLPLMLWAMGKIDAPKLWDCLNRDCGEEVATTFFKKKPTKDAMLKPDVPRICDVSIDLMRSYITRRHAAMDALWSNLWPLFKYDPRGSEAVAQLRADALTQRVDIMSDAYNYRHFFSQCRRDMLLYGQSLVFPRASWDRQISWRFKPTNTGEPGEEVESYITREGVDFVNPHPARIAYDLGAPLANVNTDTGPRWLLHWDITNYGRLIDNEQNYYNLKNVVISDGWIGLATLYGEFFGYYFDNCVLQWPQVTGALDPAVFNDREARIGLYSYDQRDMGVLVTNYFEKINPKVEGIGNYDAEVWVHLVVAGDYKVIGAEFLPSLPAAYGGVNWNDSRMANQSMGMSLLAYQDQASNIMSHMLQQIRASLVQLWLIDKDSLEEGIRKEIEANANNQQWWVDPKILMYSATKLRDLGIQDPRQAFAIVQNQLTNVVQSGLQALGQLLNLADRLLILSPNELGQPNPREVSASEVSQIATSVQAIYAFVNQGPREQTAAVKELIYESLICCADEVVRVPVEGRYTLETIKKAGFTAPERDDIKDNQIVPVRTQITGNLRDLRYDYYFDSRDGAERSIDVQGAQVIQQLITPLLQDQEIRAALGKKRVFDMINSIIRLSGAPTDAMIQTTDGESDEMPVPEQPAPQQGGDVSARIARLEQFIMKMMQGQQQPGGVPPQAAAGGAPAAPPPGSPADRLMVA